MKRQRIRARVLHMMWLCRCFMMGVGNWRGGQGGNGGSLHEGHSTDSPGETNTEKSSKGKHSFWTASSHAVLARLPYLVKCGINAVLNCSVL